MGLIETITNIKNTNLYNSNLKYCLVTKNKLPFKIDGTPARTNVKEDFVELDEILQNLPNNDLFAGVGISIQASEICAIDVDHCFSIPFDKESIDERGKDIIERFKEVAYIEFSFSGTGLRVIFKHDIIENYSDKYYIKNQNNSVEYYQPTNSFRYVTVTGKYLYNNEIRNSIEIEKILKEFLDCYMIKPVKKYYEPKTLEIETKSYEELMKLVKKHYLKNHIFQDLWFNNAPGSGKDESERDFHLVAYLFENITRDKDLIKRIFESSNFFKTKDWKHVNKWNYNNFRYFNYLYENISRR